MNNSMHLKVVGTLNGREIHNVPVSLTNKPQPSDKPTKVLDENLDFDDQKVKINVQEPEPQSLIDNNLNDDFLDTPGTTVLGLDMDDEPIFQNTDDNKLHKPDTKNKINQKIEKVEKSDDTEERQKKEKAKPKHASANKGLTTKSKVQNVSKTKKKVPRYSKYVIVRRFNGEEIKISKKDFVIGKSKYSDYQLRGNNTVSRSHIIAHKHSDGSLTLEDNDSKNGTFLDEKKLEAHEEIKVKDGQSLRMSDELFSIRKI